MAPSVHHSISFTQPGPLMIADRPPRVTDVVPCGVAAAVVLDVESGMRVEFNFADLDGVERWFRQGLQSVAVARSIAGLAPVSSEG